MPSSSFQSRLKHALDSATAAADRQLDAFWAPIAIGTVALIGLIDHLSGPDLAFSLFYFAVIVLVSWKTTLPCALAGALAISLVWLAADWFTPGAPSTAILLWNAVMRLAVLVGLGIIVYRLKSALGSERALARTDFLTGVLNARAFAEVAAVEISRARRYRRPVTVAYVDLDDFKKVNDRFGHTFGNDVLRNVASTIRHNLRDSDVVSRVGGDEFVVLLPETNRQDAEVVLTKLQAALSGTKLRDDVSITCSVGATVLHPPPPELDAVISLADALMYRAKNAGKNRLHLD